MGAASRPRVETVLLDAGGVLLDLDYSYLRRLVEAQHREVEAEELSRLEAIARREVHHRIREGAGIREMWREYFEIILGGAGVGVEAHAGIIDSLWEAHERFGLWTVAIDGGPEVVTALKQAGYRLGVISNAEGRVARDLESAGYAGLFETIVDSHLVGVEKPDPGIFAIALERLDVRAEGAVYVGDLPAVDVEGARAAAVRPILLDRHDLYPDLDVERLHDLRELPTMLDPE